MPPGGTLSDYIPLWFTPFYIIMYNIRTGYGSIRQLPNSEIVIMVSSLRGLTERCVEAVFSDRNAYLQTAQLFSSQEDLDKIACDILQRRDFRRDIDDPEKADRYQAEALKYRH